MNAAEGISEAGLGIIVVLAPLLTVLVAAVGTLVAISSLRLRTTVDTAGQWWARVQYAIDRALASSPAEQNVGLAMLDQLQGQGQLPEGLNEEQRRLWEQGSKLRWSVQPEDLLLIHAVVTELALSRANHRGEPGPALSAATGVEQDTLRRQAQLVAKIDARLGRAIDPRIRKILDGG